MFNTQAKHIIMVINGKLTQYKAKPKIKISATKK